LFGSDGGLYAAVREVASDPLIVEGEAVKELIVGW